MKCRRKGRSDIDIFRQIGANTDLREVLKVVSFDGKSVGGDAPIFLMADLGLTNGGDLSRSKADK